MSQRRGAAPKRAHPTVSQPAHQALLRCRDRRLHRWSLDTRIIGGIPSRAARVGALHLHPLGAILLGGCRHWICGTRDRDSTSPANRFQPFLLEGLWRIGRPAKALLMLGIE